MKRIHLYVIYLALCTLTVLFSEYVSPIYIETSASAIETGISVPFFYLLTTVLSAYSFFKFDEAKYRKLVTFLWPVVPLITHIISQLDNPYYFLVPIFAVIYLIVHCVTILIIIGFTKLNKRNAHET